MTLLCPPHFTRVLPLTVPIGKHSAPRPCLVTHVPSQFSTLKYLLHYVKNVVEATDRGRPLRFSWASCASHETLPQERKVPGLTSGLLMKGAHAQILPTLPPCRASLGPSLSSQHQRHSQLSAL